MNVTAEQETWKAQRFEEERPRLRAVAYRMLGSIAEADDVVQDAWLRFSRTNTDHVENLRGWLTTVVARLCLDALRSRRSRREDLLSALPDPIVSGEHDPDPEGAAIVADAVGLALLVVLETLSPAERLAFVLHDIFDVPFGEIGPLVGRSEPAARQLASRARRRVRRGAPAADTDLEHQRKVVDAFIAAARDGDFEALLNVLDPDVVARVDFGPGRAATTVLRGALPVATSALTFSRFAPSARPARVNGAAGVVVFRGEAVYAVLGFTARAGRIAEIDILADPDRLKGLDLRFFLSPPESARRSTEHIVVDA